MHDANQLLTLSLNSCHYEPLHTFVQRCSKAENSLHFCSSWQMLQHWVTV